MTSYWLDTPVGRAKFARQLYNLREMLEREGETEDMNAFNKLKGTIESHDKEFPMKSYSAKGALGGNNPRGSKRKRPGDDDPGAGAGARGVRATDCAELRAHGYEVKLEAVAIAGESGEHEMELLSRVRQPLPTHSLR